MHTSLIFFVLPYEGIRPVCRRSYVQLLRGEQPMTEYANQTIRIADWYVALDDEGQLRVDNETYSILAFDSSGQVDWPKCRHGASANSTFYKALTESKFEDPDADPAVQKIRAQLCEQFAWLPDKQEREALCTLAPSTISRTTK